MKGSEWGYLDNTKHLIIWLCHMKQLNFRHFNTGIKNVWNSNFLTERSKNGSKKANIILFSISRTFLNFLRQFRIISENFRSLPKIYED